MSDLEGDDAFDRVLDRLVEATAKLNRDEGALVEARTAATSARAAQTILEKQVAELKREQQEGLPYLEALYLAARSCLPYIGDAGSAEATVAHDHLKAALEKAEKYCDNIPF